MLFTRFLFRLRASVSDQISEEATWATNLTCWIFYGSATARGSSTVGLVVVTPATLLLLFALSREEFDIPYEWCIIFLERIVRLVYVDVDSVTVFIQEVHCLWRQVIFLLFMFTVVILKWHQLAHIYLIGYIFATHRNALDIFFIANKVAYNLIINLAIITNLVIILLNLIV